MVGGNEVLFKDIRSDNRRDRPTEATRRPSKSVAGDMEGRRSVGSDGGKAEQGQRIESEYPVY